MPGSRQADQAARANRVRPESEAELTGNTTLATHNSTTASPTPLVIEDHEFEVDVRTLSYRELQKLAMSRGINAGGSRGELELRLAEA